MQQTTFPIKLIISDDCSTDGTREKCINYQQKYPDVIELILPENNTQCQVVIDELYPACSNSGAQYIAFCEGDDYWTDPTKLQKQVDFLNTNKEFAGCFHNAVLVDGDGKTIREEMISPKKDTFLQRDIFFWNAREPTCSVVARAIVLKKLPHWFTKKPCDFYLDLLITSYGKYAYLNESMAVHIKHPGGWSAQNKFIVYNELIQRHILLIEDAYFRDNFYLEITKCMKRIMAVITQEGLTQSDKTN